jgi:hypothetical protein
MLKRLLPLALPVALLATLSLPALSAPSVPVHWKVRYELPGGQERFSVPTDSYLTTLSSCGLQPDLSAEVNEVPLAALRCPGLLDFSQNSAIHHRLKAILENPAGLPMDLSASALEQKFAVIDFGISPFGVFFSAAEEAGEARNAAINIETAHLVILNAAFWQELKGTPAGDALLVHEAFEATGINDQNFAISSAIASGKKSVQVARAEDGGASVIGRGGDPNQLIFKASLLALTDKKIAVAGVPASRIPSPENLRQVITETPVTIAPLAFLKSHEQCADMNGNPGSDAYCGGFVLQGLGGKPFLLINDQWGGQSETDKRKLLLKIFQQIVSELVRAEGN